MWHDRLWLIDHGASLLFHHSWTDWREKALSPFPYIKQHVLLPWASELAEADREFRATLTSEKIGEIVALIPDGWLDRTEPGETPEELRGVYRTYLTERLNHSEIFVNQARDAREALI